MSIQIPEDKGAKKRAGYWNGSIVLGVIGIILLAISANQPGAEPVICGGWSFCCFSVYFSSGL